MSVITMNATVATATTAITCKATALSLMCMAHTVSGPKVITTAADLQIAQQKSPQATASGLFCHVLVPCEAAAAQDPMGRQKT